MRAARLLQILLILQNRGLPIIVHQGNRGGIELGLNYLTRLTGLDAQEAEAIGIILATPNPTVEAIGLAKSAKRARAKLIESFPDRVRTIAQTAIRQFPTQATPAPDPDPRIPAIANAIRNRQIIRINTRRKLPRTVHPTALIATVDGWQLSDAITNTSVPLSDCGDINISAQKFEPEPNDTRLT